MGRTFPMRFAFTDAIKPMRLRIVLFLFLVASPICQASLQVSPTRLLIAAEHNATGLTLANTGDDNLYVQIRVYHWQQKNGEDILQPTQDIIASPPVVEVVPGVNQLVRIVRPSPAPTTEEQNFRIIIDELPVNTDQNNKPSNTVNNGLTFRLRYSVPLFLHPPKAITLQPILNASLITEKEKYFLRLSNTGNSHAHIADLAWRHNTQRTLIAAGLAGYILPGQQQQWELPEDINPTNGGNFTAKVNGELRERIIVTITAKH